MSLPCRTRSPSTYLAFVALLFCFVPSETFASDEVIPVQSEQSSCVDILSATIVANAFHEELIANPNTENQAEIVSKHLRLITMDTSNMPSDRLERLALGEGAFLSFRVQPAHDYFATLLDGDDVISQHAWDRMMQIKYRALGEVEEAKNMIDRFYEKFPPSETNFQGRYQQISNLAYQLNQDNKTEEAVALIESELRALPTNAPYASYSLLPRYAEQIKGSARQQEIRKMISLKLTELKKLHQEWEQTEQLTSEDPVLRGDMPMWYWRSQRILPGESLRMGRKRQLKSIIGGLEKWLTG